ncbi:MAG: type II secretion system protein [Burkholderiales bacterium]|nr:type II secretion system protein [Burkholderiales bacterium]
MNRAPIRAGLSGFTLIEVLVVLGITSLVATILMQALYQTYNVQERFGVQLVRSQRAAMTEDWFRQAIEGLQATRDDDPNRFLGTPQHLHGVSIAAVSERYGAPEPIDFTLEFSPDTASTALVLHRGDARTTLFDWPGKNGGFIYLDAKGDRHEQWPPELENLNQLPSAVLLRMTRDGEPWLLFAMPKGGLQVLRPQQGTVMLGATP